jgi:hypothetical protein
MAWSISTFESKPKPTKKNKSIFFIKKTLTVVTLALGSQPKQVLARVRDKRKVQEAHLILPGV